MPIALIRARAGGRQGRGERPLVLLALAAIACAGAALPRPGSPLARAQAAFDAGRPREALGEARAAIAAAPDTAAPHLLAGRVYLALEDGVAAEAEIEKARATGASRDETRADLAAAYLLQDEAPDALAEADPAAVPPAYAPQVLRIRGRALAATGDLASAAIAFGAALRMAPADPQLWTDVGRFRLFTGNRAAAIAAANRAVTLAPKLVDALLLKGELSRDQYGLVAALPWFARAVAADPGSVPALLDQAATLGDAGRTRAMLASVRAALRLEPGNSRAFYLAAVLAARDGRFALARRMLDRAGDDLDDVPGAMLLDGAVDMATGNSEQAIDRLGRLVAAQPGNDRARRLLGAAQWQVGDADAAVTTLAPLADRADAESYDLMLMARALERRGRRDQAAPYLDRAAMPQRSAAAASADPAPPGSATPALDAELVAGDALVAIGRPADAVPHYRAAANLAFTEPVALRLIDALRRSGDFAGAAGVLNLFLGQHPMDVPARILAAAYLMETGRPAQAAGMLDRLRRQTGGRDAALLNNLAWARYRLGSRGVAIAIAGKAHRLLPANAEIADSFGWMLLDSRTAPDAGMALLEQAAAVAPGEPLAQARLAAARARFPAA